MVSRHRSHRHDGVVSASAQWPSADAGVGGQPATAGGHLRARTLRRVQQTQKGIGLRRSRIGEHEGGHGRAARRAGALGGGATTNASAESGGPTPLRPLQCTPAALVDARERGRASEMPSGRSTGVFSLHSALTSEQSYRKKESYLESLNCKTGKECWTARMKLSPG